MKPKVSICVPNLNTRPFLPERFETIFGQSFQDWELLVYDGYSTDGSWEYIQELAAAEKRMRIWQGPRQGPLASWNPCIRAATGEYIYVATSDDTMAPDCLEKLVGALDEYQDCGLAHCPLVYIDETGTPISSRRRPEDTVFGLSAGALLNHSHLRKAPYDGLLSLTGRYVYFSFTQLLVRQSLFAKVGGLESRWGAMGDFNWYMKAGLLSSAIHVPNTWASLRVHSQSASSALNVCTRDFYGKIEDMINDALGACEKSLDPLVAAGLRSHWSDWTREMRSYDQECTRLSQNPLQKRWFQFSRFLTKSAVRDQILNCLLGRKGWTENTPAKLKDWLETLGLGPVLTPAQAEPAASSRLLLSAKA